VEQIVVSDDGEFVDEDDAVKGPKDTSSSSSVQVTASSSSQIQISNTSIIIE